ncbi:MAG: hypothetical protein ACOX45_07400 [Acutalibacteraceae bacterium]
MFRNEIKYRFINYTNILWLILLPVAWHIGTDSIRANIKFMELGILSHINDPDTASVTQAITEQLNAKNGFMVFMEGCSEFYIPIVICFIGWTCFFRFVCI